MLRNLREQKGLTQKELAYKTDVTIQAINNYELNKRTPPIPIFNRITKALKLSNKQKAELLQSFDKRKGD